MESESDADLTKQVISDVEPFENGQKPSFADGPDTGLAPPQFIKLMNRVFVPVVSVAETLAASNNRIIIRHW